MTLDTLRCAVRDGPDAFPDGGTPTWFVASFVHWRTWINLLTVCVVPFLWAVAPYWLSPPGASASILELWQYHYGLVPWLLVRPLRLLAAAPLLLWFLCSFVRVTRL